MSALCTECGGSGYFVSDYGPAPDEQVCDACEGSGEFDADDLGIISVARLNEQLRYATADLSAAYDEMVAAASDFRTDRYACAVVRFNELRTRPTADVTPFPMMPRSSLVRSVAA
jgi:hypothetical protein